jgi:hypothetical protein
VDLLIFAIVDLRLTFYSSSMTWLADVKLGQYLKKSP